MAGVTFNAQSMSDGVVRTYSSAMNVTGLLGVTAFLCAAGSWNKFSKTLLPWCAHLGWLEASSAKPYCLGVHTSVDLKQVQQNPTALVCTSRLTWNKFSEHGIHTAWRRMWTDWSGYNAVSPRQPTHGQRRLTTLSLQERVQRPAARFTERVSGSRGPGHKLLELNWPVLQIADTFSWISGPPVGVFMIEPI